MIRRRDFLTAVAGSAGGAAFYFGRRSAHAAARDPSPTLIQAVDPDEDIFAYVRRVKGSFDAALYKRILGTANEFKEGDAIVGVAAADDESRANARLLLANTRVGDIDRHPLLKDQLFRLLTRSRDAVTAASTANMRLGELKQFLLRQDETAIRSVMGGLSSDVIACVVKLMGNQDLIAIGAKVFNPLPGSHIGARGYLGARIQPNSPTDNLDDIRWQVFDGWAYAVGDVLLGNNPVSSEPRSVEAIQQTLQDLLVTFEVDDVMPHCVLSHIDVQAEVERERPGSTALWFQSIAGSDTANATFDVSLEKMLKYANTRTGTFRIVLRDWSRRRFHQRPQPWL